MLLLGGKNKNSESISNFSERTNPSPVVEHGSVMRFCFVF